MNIDTLETEEIEASLTSASELVLLQQFAESVAGVFFMLRKQKGYTSYESFAFDHDFPRAQYWRVETGRHNLTLRTLAKLLAIHNLSLVKFLELVIEEKKAGNPSFKSHGKLLK
jgi:transcriptional regulator with XRE-family HTH domain